MTDHPSTQTAASTRTAASAPAVASTAAAAAPHRQQLIELLGELARAIELELEALAQHDHAALIAATSAKRAQLGRIDGFWRRNDDIANTLSDPAAPHASELAAITDRCRTLNAAAGAAIATLGQRVAGTLALLGHGHPVAYSPHGKCTAGPVSRHTAVC